MTDYSQITDDEFDGLLIKIMDLTPSSDLLQIPGVYKVLSEHFNNVILDTWEYGVVDKIKNWDHEKIEGLRDLLQKIPESELIEWSDLPSEEIPEDIDTSYPVWAMDRRGYLLVGEELTIEHISDHRELMKE